MEHKIRVNVGARNGPPIVEADRAIGWTARTFVAIRACSRSVEGRKLAVGTAQESVFHTVRVNVNSRNRPQLIEAQVTTRTTRTLVAASTRAGNVEYLQLSVGSPHVAMVNKVVVAVASRDDSERINVGSPRTVATLRTVGNARAGTNPCRKFAVRAPHEGAK